MMTHSSKHDSDDNEPYLVVYGNKSVLFDGQVREVFDEGKPDQEALNHLRVIKATLEKGFLDDIILQCKAPDVNIGFLTETQTRMLTTLVGFTSEVGRAIVGLTLYHIAFDQSIFNVYEISRSNYS